MDEYCVLKSVLDNLCDKMDLNSWTLHENSKGTVCTLRFANVSSILNPQAGEDTRLQKYSKRKFRRQSEKQEIRDSNRMCAFIAKKHAENSTTELDLSQPDDFQFSPSTPVNNPMHSSMSSPLNLEATPFRMSTDINNTSIEAPSMHNVYHQNESNITTEESTDIHSIQFVEENIIEEPYAICENLELEEQFKATESTVLFIPEPCHISDTPVSLRSETVYDPPYVESVPGCDNQTSTCMDVDGLSYDITRLLAFENQRDTEISSSLSSDDPLCGICSAIPPFHTHMLHCPKCSFHLCGSCALMNPIENSHNCYFPPEYIGSNMHGDLRKNEQKSHGPANTDQCVPIGNSPPQYKLSRYKSLEYAYDPSFEADTYFKKLWDSCFVGPYLGNLSIHLAEFYKERTLFKLKRGPGSDYQLLLVSGKNKGVWCKMDPTSGCYSDLVEADGYEFSCGKWTFNIDIIDKAKYPEVYEAD